MPDKRIRQNSQADSRCFITVITEVDEDLAEFSILTNTANINLREPTGDGSQKGSHRGSQKRGQVVREGVTWGCRYCELFRLGISSTRTGSNGAQDGTT